MKYQELEEMLSDKAFEMMNEGWKLVPGNTSYSGVNASIALRKGNDYRVIYLSNATHERGENGRYMWGIEVIRLAVVEARKGHWGSVDFERDGSNEIECKKFYTQENGCDRDNWYVDTLAEAKALYDLRMERYEANKESFQEKHIECTDRLLKMIRTREGFKTAKKSDIVIKKQSNGYYIKKKGNDRFAYTVKARRA